MSDERINNLDGEIWSEDDDLALSEAVLSSVRRGGSAIQGCRDFEEATNGARTESANKFRWHTRLKNQYKAAYEMAREEGMKQKNRPNQGQRYEQVITNVLDKEEDEELTIEDVFVVMKKFRDQKNDVSEDQAKLEREVSKLTNENRKLEKELNDLKYTLSEQKEALVNKNDQYRELMNSLQVLKKAGIQINIPEEKQDKYIINRDGTVEKLDGK